MAVEPLARALSFAILLSLLFGTAAARVPATRAIQWTATNPPIDLTHIETGEITAAAKRSATTTAPTGSIRREQRCCG